MDHLLIDHLRQSGWRSPGRGGGRGPWCQLSSMWSLDVVLDYVGSFQRNRASAPTHICKKKKKIHLYFKPQSHLPKLHFKYYFVVQSLQKTDFRFQESPVWFLIALFTRPFSTKTAPIIRSAASRSHKPAITEYFPSHSVLLLCFTCFTLHPVEQADCPPPHTDPRWSQWKLPCVSLCECPLHNVLPAGKNSV